MALTQTFEYRRPGSIQKAVKLLAKHGRRASVLAGGTDLVGRLRDEVLNPACVVDVKDIGELKGITIKNGILRLGSLA
ncbi:MAG: FAD binding domain-containing protein, partial [Lentisphaerota bacterium]